MYSKAQLLKSLQSEAKIIKHLATQVPAGQLDYRPTPAQRSTLELLQYLTMVTHSSTRYVVEGGWEWYDAMAAQAKLVTPETFAKAMDKQTKAVTKLIARFNDAQLRKKTAKSWSGSSLPLGEALLEMGLKPIVAYRMQLFLYAKASGAAQLGTSDLWRGKAAKPAKAMKAAKA